MVDQPAAAPVTHKRKSAEMAAASEFTPTNFSKDPPAQRPRIEAVHAQVTHPVIPTSLQRAVSSSLECREEESVVAEAAAEAEAVMAATRAVLHSDIAAATSSLEAGIDLSVPAAASAASAASSSASAVFPPELIHPLSNSRLKPLAPLLTPFIRSVLLIHTHCNSPTTPLPTRLSSSGTIQLWQSLRLAFRTPKLSTRSWISRSWQCDHSWSLHMRRQCDE
jgi:hypothetical protein